jgi:AcrR family transcriptional regulator
MSRSRKNSRGEATREQFLQLAMVAIADLGISGLSVSDLVKASGMTRPTFYSYFGDRDGLLAELWLERGEEWTLRMLQAGGDFDYRSPFFRSLTQVFLYCHRSVDLKELVTPGFKLVLDREYPAAAERSVALWRMANRIGVVATAPVWPSIAEAMFLEEYLDGLGPSVTNLKPTVQDPLPVIQLPERPDLSREMVEGVITIIHSSGVEGISILRLGRVMRVTSGFLNPRIDDLQGLVGQCYQIVQDAAVQQNLALWSKLRLTPEGFARFIVGSVGSTRRHWRNFRTEVLIAAAHDPTLAESVSQSMDSFQRAITERTRALLFPKPLVSRVALLVHTMLFGFTAINNAGINVGELAHVGVIRALLGRVARHYTGFGKART